MMSKKFLSLALALVLSLSLVEKAAELSEEALRLINQQALRELKEETGAVPDTFLPLGRIIPAPGCYGEVLHLFLAKGLHMEEQHLDPDEFLNVERIPFNEMVHRCLNGEIEDAKTVAAVLKAKVLLNL